MRGGRGERGREERWDRGEKEKRVRGGEKRGER